MINREKVIKGLKVCFLEKDCLGCVYEDTRLKASQEKKQWDDWHCPILDDVIALLKEQENEYENGFNDAMLGKQELMYEGIDGKWHKKDW